MPTYLTEYANVARLILACRSVTLSVTEKSILYKALSSMDIPHLPRIDKFQFAVILDYTQN